MEKDREQAREFDRMRGEYLGLMASLEFNLTGLLVEWLDVGSHQEEFRRWFIEVPIPFRAKVRLYEAVTEGSMITEQFGNLAEQMRKAYDFRNTLAHSFRQFDRLTTSRGVEVPAERVSFEVLEGQLKKLSDLGNLFLNLLGAELEGPAERVLRTTTPIGRMDCSFLDTSTCLLLSNRPG